MKKKNLGTRIIAKAMKPAWELENEERSEASRAKIIEDALKISFLHTETEMMRKHQGDKVIFDSQKEAALKELLEANSIEMVDGENPALKLLVDCTEPLPELIEKYGEDENLFDARFLEKAKVIIEYYPKYAWLMENWKKFRKGKVALNECIEVTKPLFENAGVEGRFKWNIHS